MGTVWMYPPARAWRLPRMSPGSSSRVQTVMSVLMTTTCSLIAFLPFGYFASSARTRCFHRLTVRRVTL